MDINISSKDYSSYINTASADSLKSKLSNVDTEGDEKMLEACKEFEAYMIEQVYKQMEKTTKMFSDDEDSSTSYESMFGDMRVQEMAKRASDQGGIGLAQQLYDSMKRQASGITPEQLASQREAVELSKKAEQEAAKNAPAQSSSIKVDEA